MNLTLKDHHKYTSLIVDGKLDANTVPLLKSELIILVGKSEKDIVLDLSSCNYCDVDGANALIIANRLCKNSNRTFFISGIGAQIEYSLSLIENSKQLNLFNNISEAEDKLFEIIKK